MSWQLVETRGDLKIYQDTFGNNRYILNGSFARRKGNWVIAGVSQRHKLASEAIDAFYLPVEDISPEDIDADQIIDEMIEVTEMRPDFAFYAGVNFSATLDGEPIITRSEMNGPMTISDLAPFGLNNVLTNMDNMINDPERYDGIVRITIHSVHIRARTDGEDFRKRYGSQ